MAHSGIIGFDCVPSMILQKRDYQDNNFIIVIKDKDNSFIIVITVNFWILLYTAQKYRHINS